MEVETASSFREVVCRRSGGIAVVKNQGEMSCEGLPPFMISFNGNWCEQPRSAAANAVSTAQWAVPAHFQTCSAAAR